MLKNELLTISLLLPLMAASASAHAGSTITDKSYWPNEARQSVILSSFLEHEGCVGPEFKSSRLGSSHGYLLCAN